MCDNKQLRSLYLYGTALLYISEPYVSEVQLYKASSRFLFYWEFLHFDFNIDVPWTFTKVHQKGLSKLTF